MITGKFKDNVVMSISRKKIFLFSFLMTLFVVFVILSAYFILSVGGRSYKLYSLIKSPEGRGWEGIVHEADPLLGYRPVPLAQGFEVLPDGKNVMRVVFNENGCRVPHENYGREPERKSSSPTLLFLGCSFTFGSACPAEDTFPFLLAERIGGTAFNAGVISYGFPQMIIRARHLIPEIKPTFVVLQSSPWLIFRGNSMYRPTRYGNVPVPYFTKDDNGYKIVPPVYPTNIFDVPIRDFINTPG